MRLLHIVPSLEDRHGGPSKSVRALANSLARAGDDVELLTTGEQPVELRQDDAATLCTFPRITPRWLTRSPELSRHLQATPADCLHHHSLWLLTLRYSCQAAARRKLPLIISPRGMMSEWAYQHHRWRKMIAEHFVHPGAFTAATGWHATSQTEADDIHRLGFRQPVCVSPNGVEIPSPEELTAARSAWHELCPASRSRPVALFYSRFHRKKRLRELIDLWLSTPRGDWLLFIAGLPEEYTAEEITRWITSKGASDSIVVISGANRPHPYAVASLFLLPSHSENFGLVIAEALAAGVPTLVTDTTPWQGLAANGCGWCVPWEDYAQTLDTALSLPTHELSAMGANGRVWATREFSWERVADVLRNFYQELIHERR